MEAETGREKPTLRSYAHKVADNDADVVTYEADFDLPPGFGEVGAVLVTNEHHTEMFLEDVSLYTNSDSGSDSDSDSGSDDARAAFIGAARAALEALREPSEEMILSGRTSLSRNPDRLHSIKALDAWQDMLDAALAEGTK